MEASDTLCLEELFIPGQQGRILIHNDASCLIIPFFLMRFKGQAPVDLYRALLQILN